MFCLLKLGIHLPQILLTYIWKILENGDYVTRKTVKYTFSEIPDWPVQMTFPYFVICKKFLVNVRKISKNNTTLYPSHGFF